ncbi:unnamed protein product [Oikopleura dioica]|uniref:Uncharacterized protein n=1 Tax=Oikopleura dioica TaxID=34765 RepID=E4XSQ4_OIKDI|nr:unnamed protein product [Oikopleura dioica]CBY38204.1 unnamed protein product [Oikopleura dioica]
MSLAALAKKHSEQASASTKSLSSLIKSKTSPGVSLKNLSAKAIFEFQIALWIEI